MLRGFQLPCCLISRDNLCDCVPPPPATPPFLPSLSLRLRTVCTTSPPTPPPSHCFWYFNPESVLMPLLHSSDCNCVVSQCCRPCVKFVSSVGWWSMFCHAWAAAWSSATCRTAAASAAAWCTRSSSCAPTCATSTWPTPGSPTPLSKSERSFCGVVLNPGF